MIETIALIISLVSLLISSFFAIKSMQRSTTANELSESQKTAALISILSPACQDPKEWRMFINYLSKNDRLPHFSQEDQDFLASILNRLRIKATIVSGRLKAEN